MQKLDSKSSQLLQEKQPNLINRGAKALGIVATALFLSHLTDSTTPEANKDQLVCSTKGFELSWEPAVFSQTMLDKRAIAKGLSSADINLGDYQLGLAECNRSVKIDEINKLQITIEGKIGACLVTSLLDNSEYIQSPKSKKVEAICPEQPVGYLS